jgi:DedD protein
MTGPQDTEITLGTGKLLFLFFGLVAICAAFFAIGYSLGRKSEPVIAATSAGVPQTASTATKAGKGAASAPPMTFYKSVEQKDANPQLSPGTDAKTDTASGNTPADGAANHPAANQTPATNTADAMTTLPTAGYFVQVAAVSKQEDANALVDALKAKQYPAFVAPQSATDKLFHVQVGPYTDIKDAEAMRTRLISDGYSPIVKK